MQADKDIISTLPIELWICLFNTFDDNTSKTVSLQTFALTCKSASNVANKCFVIYEERPVPFNQLFNAIAYMGCCDLLRYAHERCPISVDSILFAARGGSLECLKFIYNVIGRWHDETCATAAKYGNFECLKFAHKNGAEMEWYTAEAAARYGRVKCLEYYSKHDETHYWRISAIRIAIRHEKIEVVEYLANKHEFNVDSDMIALAINTKNIGIIEILRRFGGRIFRHTCSGDEGKCLELHKYASAHRVDMLASGDIPAVLEGHLDCLKFIYDSGVQMSNIIRTAAATSERDVDRLKLIVAQGGFQVIGGGEFAAKVSERAIECLEYCAKNNFKRRSITVISNDACRDAIIVASK
jgi:hypothetical protein